MKNCLLYTKDGVFSSLGVSPSTANVLLCIMSEGRSGNGVNYVTELSPHGHIFNTLSNTPSDLSCRHLQLLGIVKSVCF